MIARLSFKRASLAEVFHVMPIVLPALMLRQNFEHIKQKGSYGGLVLDIP